MSEPHAICEHSSCETSNMFDLGKLLPAAIIINSIVRIVYIMGSIRSRSLEENFHTIWQETWAKRTEGNTNIHSLYQLEPLGFGFWMVVHCQYKEHDIRSSRQATKEMEIGSFLKRSHILWARSKWYANRSKIVTFFPSSIEWIEWLTWFTTTIWRMCYNLAKKLGL